MHFPARFIKRSALASMELAEPRLPFIGALGVIGFPLYYVIWAHVFPQPYENLPLRLGLALLCVPLLLPGRWPDRLARRRPLYLLALVFLCIPFFFPFMALRNEFSPAWTGSCVVALVMVLYLLDLATGLLVLAAGVGVAFVAAALTGPPIEDWSGLIETLPILGFAVAAMAALNLTLERMTRAKMDAAVTLAGHIAHELRTPFGCIRSATESMRRTLETLDGRRCPGPCDARAEAHGLMADIPADIGHELTRASLVIDLLVDNAGSRNQTAGRDRVVDARACAAGAVARYPFPREELRAWVQIGGHAESRYPVRVDPLLLEHVFLNLLENSLWAVRAAGRGSAGHITIAFRRDADSVQIRFADNGTGIARAQAPHVFEPFYSTRREGTGLGLHFVAKVIREAGGSIHCESRAGDGTTFHIRLPVARAQPAPATTTMRPEPLG